MKKKQQQKTNNKVTTYFYLVWSVYIQRNTRHDQGFAVYGFFI